MDERRSSDSVIGTAFDGQRGSKISGGREPGARPRSLVGVADALSGPEVKELCLLRWCRECFHLFSIFFYVSALRLRFADIVSFRMYLVFVRAGFSSY